MLVFTGTCIFTNESQGGGTGSACRRPPGREASEVARGIQREIHRIWCIQTSPRWCLDSFSWIFVRFCFWEMPKLWWFDVSNFSEFIIKWCTSRNATIVWLQGFGMIGGPLGYLRSSPLDHPNGSKTHLKVREFWYVVFGALKVEAFCIILRQLMAFCQVSHQGSTWDRYTYTARCLKNSTKGRKRSTGPNDSSHILPKCNFLGAQLKKQKGTVWNLKHIN